MSRVTQLDPAQTFGKTHQLLEAVRTQLGSVPNLFRVFGNSPAALEAYIGFDAALAGGVLPAKVRDQIALVVAEINDCSYCRNAHAYLGAKAGLNDRQIADARNAIANDAHTEAVLNLARNVVVQRGELSDSEFKAARTAHLTDAEIVETVANVALNILTNYVNHVAQTVVDFPEVKTDVCKTTAAVPAEACATPSCGCA